jgi:NodT family efflux transporter outer membrane factor (OMF) lipoprotein
MRGARHLVLAAAFALAACALKQPPPVTELREQALPNLKLPAQWSAPGGAPAGVTDDWLASFNDPALDALVREALEYNTDLRAAAARVETAAGYVKLSGATLYPQVNVLARGGGKMGGDPSGLQGIGVFATWELDLWGRVRATQQGAQLAYDAATLDAAFARQSIAAQTAKAWFLATEAQLQLALANDSAVSSERLVGLARERQRIGSGDEYGVATALAALDTYRDVVAQLELARAQALRALEILVGRYPAAAIEVPARFAAMPPPVPVGLPSELLERRPDVVAAERRVAAAFYGIEQAKAARLPRISLTANLTSVSSDLFVLKERDNPVASIGASLLAPIFLGYALQAQVEIRTGEQAQAIAEYGRVSSRVFGEVENALSAGFALEQRTTILAQAIADNARALELSQVRYRVGSDDLRAVNQQQLALYASRSAQIRVEAERRVQRVNLHLALGGSFEPPAPAAAATTSDASGAVR